MKGLKKIISPIIFVALIFQPTNNVRCGTLKWLVAGLSIFTVGGLAATTITYKTARNRPIKTAPAPLNFSTFGNKEGQPAIYSHGLGRWGQDALKYTSILDEKKYHVATFDYPDVGNVREKLQRNRFNYDHVNLGQEKDIKRLQKAVKRFNKPNTIAFGVSRGASTLVNFMASDKSKNISALILESPFAKTTHAIKHVSKQQPYLRYVPLITTLSPIITQAIFPQYKNDGPQPINSITKIKSSIPILILHAKNDTICPINDSRDLYIKRKLQGVSNVYIAEFDCCKHGKLLFETTKNKAQAIIHAFYKKHNFPYNSKLAGTVNLDEFQPSVEDMQKIVKTPKARRK